MGGRAQHLEPRGFARLSKQQLDEVSLSAAAGRRAHNAAMPPEERSERARRAVSARYAAMTPEERSAVARNAREGKARKAKARAA
jgi:hypothetical protein